MSDHSIAYESCIVRNTGKQKGRTRAVTPEKTAARYLHYGRIIVEAGDPPLNFVTGEQETALICLKGSALVRAGDSAFQVKRYDSVYVPRDEDVAVEAGAEGCDLAEVSAPVETRYSVQHIPFEEIQRNPALHFKAGGPSAERDLNILIGDNVQAGRILAGITLSKPGNWTSWPPHEHAAMLEEAYLFIDMPAPAWGVQFVYTDPREPELAVVVREDDCVLMPKGYHPNVAAPGGSINFLWMMAANREGVDRKFGVVNVQPEYAKG
jgi:5-deoxy-glucuronate isomerase